MEGLGLNILFAFWFSALLASKLAAVMYVEYTHAARFSPPSGNSKLLESIGALALKPICGQYNYLSIKWGMHAYD